jgi:hypothetical protein
MLQIGVLGASIIVLNNLRAFWQGMRLIMLGNNAALVFTTILLFYFVRGFSETISVFPGTNIMLIIVLFQMIIWKSYYRATARPIASDVRIPVTLIS